MSVEYWVWLQQVLGYGSYQLSLILNEYGNAKNFYKADDKEKSVKCKLTPQQISRLHSITKGFINKIIKTCYDNNIGILTPDDERYPELLKNIADPPAVIYYKGILPDFNTNVCISIVGPRHPTVYGEKLAYLLSGTLSECGCLIVSGGAIGIDSASHLGALNALKPTVAVLGCGILSKYLISNEPLRKRIVQNGCLLTEYIPNYPASKTTFPQRNRIISGIALGTAVIEGKIRSGGLITARHANEQGRDVFVVPGSPTDAAYEGSNKLLKIGAKPLLSVNDILEEYCGIYKGISLCSKHINNIENVDYCSKANDTVNDSTINSKQIKKTPDISGVSDIEKNIIKCFKGTDITADEIVQQTGIDISIVITSLVHLQILDIVTQLPGGCYSLNTDRSFK